MQSNSVPLMDLEDRENDIAVVGMACRLPGARDVAEFWTNLCAGTHSISFFSEEELRAQGVDEDAIRHPSFVPAYGAVPEAWCFDAPFFGMTKREAMATDPQQRALLECAWTALEDAGVDPARFAGAIAVFAGSGSTGPHLNRVLADAELVEALGEEVALFANARDFLTTRVSYKLGLQGPSVVVQTACSTSLVAIHLACQSLLNRECDLALAGGVTISPEQVSGYRYQEGGIVSPDGHCRAFDAAAAGTISASGAGVVALKRFADAVRDGDVIHAVVKGSAINNDGAGKVGFTAPSVKGQARAIAEALEVAGVDPADVHYVETHGTGTALGDPIEVAALTQVFRTATDETGFCALGALKTSIGHTDTAAGVAGFIKAVLALKHRTLPPTLHFTSPNPELGLETSPFFVNTALRAWESDGPRFAGVSSFGMGGTNAHAVLEEAPELPSSADVDDAAQLLVLSAKSDVALERMRARLAAHLAENPDVSLADVAFTLQEGRAAHAHRWAAAARDVDGARAALLGEGARKPAAGRAGERASVAFLFPGQGTQHAGMARELYAAEPVFRAELDRCAQLLQAELGMDLRDALFPAEGGEDEANALLRETRLTQPALFAVEYALAKVWMSWGVQPGAMLGHSIGEYVAACLARVFSLQAALRLVAARGRLMQALPAGAMLAVPLPEAEVAPLLSGALSLAAVNSAAHCVVSGPAGEIDALEAALAERGVSARRLHTSHAFHSGMMDPVLDAFAAEVRRARPQAPSIPFVSNVTGDWTTAEQATDPAYWAGHLRRTVRFSDGVGRLLDDPNRVLLEVGPGETLGTFARRHERAGAGRTIVRSLPAAGKPDDSVLTVLQAAGALWTAGVEIDASALRQGRTGRRLHLPSYPFDRTEYRVPRAPEAPHAPALRVADAPRIPQTTIVPVAATPIAAPDRRARIAGALAGVFARLLGTEPAQVDADTSFLELGADSLLLMQASRTLESTFGVKVPFRQLLEGISTLDALSAHLDRELAPDFKLPGEPEPAPAPAAEPVAAVAPQPAAVVHAAPIQLQRFELAEGGEGSGMQALFAQQLAIIQRQLDLLGGAPAHPGSNGGNGHAGNGHGGNGHGGNGHHGNGGNGGNGHHAPAAHEPSRVERVQAAAATLTTNGGATGQGVLATLTTNTPASHGPHRPVSATVGLGGGYTERQAAHFADLVARYTARTGKSKEYAAENRPHLSDNRASLNFRRATKELMYPIVGERSQGSRLWDVDGNEYVDFAIGFGVHFFGHRPPFIEQAVEAQLHRGVHLGPQSDVAGPAARLLAKLTGQERVTFCNTGSEAVMTALRIARTVTGRDKVVMFEGSYHGCFDGILGRPGGVVDGTPRARPVAPGTPQGMVDDLVILPYGAPETLAWIEENASIVAAVLVEPVQSRNPEYHPREFLRELRALTERTGAVLVWDEMITGLRLGHRGAQGFYGIEADLSTYGKVIGGGFPLGVIAGKARFMDAIDGGPWSYGDDSVPQADQTFFAGTFCKHPVTMAAAYAVLRHLEERGQALYDELHARTDRLVAALRRVIDEEQAPIHILNCASLFHFRPDPQNPFGDLLFYEMLQRGVYVWEGRTCFVSTAHTDADCDRLVAAFRDSIHALRAGGFLPGTPGPDGGSAVHAGADLTPGAAEASDRRPFALTPAQRQIWAHAQLGDDASRAYNEQIVFGLRGRFDAAALKAAVDDVMRHHQALRLVFDPAGEWQRVDDALPIPFFVEDTADTDDALAAATDRAVRGAFDLARGPLFRVHVHPRGAERHAVQMVVHHLVADGFSGPLLRRDLLDAYRARLAGRAPRLAPAMQFADYAARLAAQADATGEDAWLARFAGATPLELPTDRPRPRFPAHPAATRTLSLPAEVVAGLREVGRREGCTLFSTLLAGVLAAVHRMAGQDDFVVGIPSAGRPFDGAETLVGDCVDVLPVRTVLAPGQTVRQYLKSIRDALLDAQENEAFAWSRLQERLQLPRGPGHPPLVSLVVNLEPMGIEGDDDGAADDGLVIEGVGGSAAFAKFDLTIDAVETGAGMELVCLFDTDLFDDATIARMLSRVGRVLEQLPASAALPVADVELMDAAERETVLRAWNHTAADVPAGRCIHQLIEAQAARTPDAPAVTFEGETLDYAALNARANRLAHLLRGDGVGPEIRVGVLMERSLEMVVALLAIHKAGGAYVPLDPGYPAERLAYLLDDSAVSLVLAQAALAGALAPRDGVKVLAVDGLAERLAAEPAENLDGGAGPDSLAYVIYTSGSTGRPKGVMNAHRGVVNRLCWMQAHFGIGADDVVLQKTPFGFDVSVWEFFWPLMTGARLVMARPDGHRDPAYLQRAIEDEGVTTLHFVPSMLQPFVDAADPARCASLRRVACSGEALPAALVDRFHARFPETVSLTNLYGPTEAAVDVSWWSCARGASTVVVPIGRPVWNTALYVLDSALRPLPTGTPGELYIGGVQVARGYLGRPSLTAERFVPDPFGAPGARLYRTGDRARWTGDGAVEYLGRVDFQVKIRGFRIEPGEIEAALRGAAGVAECAVVARDDDGSGDRRLVAYVVGQADAAALREHLRRSLPEHMVPSAFVTLDRLPLSPNGKLDRKALPAPPRAEGDGYLAPRTPVEEVLAGIWAELLNAGRVGAADSFFDLGGHSLLATRMASRVAAALGVELPLREVFDAPTLADLAERIEQLRRAERPALPAIAPADRTQPIPLSFAQERLWFVDRLRPGGSDYNVPMALRLRGALNVPALERAIGEIVRRHETLRTTFAETDGGPVQSIAPFAGFVLSVEEVAGVDDEELRRRASDWGARPFDLAAGPLFRASLLRVADDDHVLQMAMHHSVSDGWSLGVLLRELASLYETYENGAESLLPPLAVQYADFAAWQRAQLQGPALDAQVAWWKERLSGAPALLELPADHPRPAVRSHRGAHEVVAFPAEVLRGLQALARREGATLYMVLLGAFQTLLGRYAGTDDVVVGSPIAGRTRRETEELIGFFVNTLVLRTDLSDDPTFGEVLRRVRHTTLGAYEHQDVPFERLVDALQPERSLSHSPLFQVMFTLQSADSADARMAGLQVDALQLDSGTSKFDLSLTMVESDDGLWAALVYSTDLFERETAVRILGHLGRVLAQVAADAEAPLSALDLLGEEERALVVSGWNATDCAYPADATVHALFEATAARTPDAVAVRADDGVLSYAELNARANRLARHLASLGVGPDVCVGFCMERGADLAVGLLAILKAGGAYLPLDPAYPADRLRMMVEDAAPAALVSHTPIQALAAELVAGLPVPVVRVDADAAAWAGLSAEDVDAGAGPDNLVYVIYTSGSTGRPKGVMNHHRCLVNRLAWTRRAWEIGPDDVVLAKTALSFDGHVRELFLPWHAGATSVMARPGGQRDPDYLLDVIGREGVTTVNLVPSMLQVLMEHPEAERMRGLARVLCGGEGLPGGLLMRFLRTLPGTKLHNLYGPSEAATAMTLAECGPANARPVVPIGRPTGNVRTYVLDGAGRPVPAGVVGELYVGGTAVARGYLGRPGQTAERFLPDPFSAHPGARFYRSGDRVRWLADGTVEFLGRADFQVKVRGFRIEPGEVEARLREHHGVRDALVVAAPDASGAVRLVAYCVAAEIDPQALRAHVAARLPDYMVPAAYVRLDALPLGPSGKLDRKALPAPDGDSFAARAWEAPAGAAEEAVAEVWTQVLGVERVGRWDHFFELGGHSLRAVQVISRVRRALGVEVALGELFLRPVLADFAAALESAAPSALPPIVPVPRDAPLPLSFAQQRLWFIERMGGAGSAFHVPLRLRLTGELDRDALERALRRIIHRHEALRTVFSQDGAEPVQRVVSVEETGFALADTDLSGEADGALARWMEDEAEAPFHLECGPLVRARLIRLAADDHVLLVTLHHIATDGWSVDLLVGELSALYTAFVAGDDDPLAPLPVQYADYAAWQRRSMDGPALARQADWWERELRGAPALLELPADRPRPAQQDFTGAAAGFELDEALTARLNALSRRHGATLFMTLMAAWAAVLSRLSGQRDVVVGTPSANRARPEIEGVIGFFINTLAVRVRLDDAPTVAQLLARVRQATLGAQQNGDLPFEQVVERLHPARSLAHTPIFQVAFAWQNTPGGSLELPGLTLGALEGEPWVPAQYDMTLSLREGDGRVAGGVAYAAALFEPATVRRWLGYLRNLLQAMADDDSAAVATLPLIGDGERRMLVDGWNQTDRPYPRDVTLHARFAAQVAARPDAEALVWGAETLTYAQLDARANRLANHLASLGVGPERRVGLLMERGVELIVSLLAVIKAGGCYVPLDPSYPAGRLELMLADAGVGVLVTEGGLASALDVPAVAVVRLDEAADALAAESDRAPESGATPENLAYIVYTSGSTGRPKGVMVNHRTVVQLVVETDYVTLAPGDRIAQASNASFDALTFEAWGAFLNGATLVGIPRDVLLSPAEFARVLRDERITTLYQTTALLNQLSREQPGIFAPLREVLFGGQAADADSVRRLLRHGKPRRLLHMYGPTETTAWCSYDALEALADDALTVPVGRPTGNQRIYLLDDSLHPVPLNVPGEAYVGGGGVVRGYLDRPSLTAERFLPDPFATEPGARMYRTGDRLRWKEVRECESAEVRKWDGGHDVEDASTLALSQTRTYGLDFVGRVDDQVKIRGFRIEPGEVEGVLATHRSVAEARVIVREDTPGEKRLVAYVVGGADGVELRSHLEAVLPEYMVPAAFVAVERLPLTPNGKLDVAALPAPERATVEYQAPRTPVEQALADIWAELLRCDRVGARDDFFALGGHSLLIMRLIAHARDAFGVELGIRDVFAAPVLADMAAQVEGRILDDILGMTDAQAEELAALTPVAGD